MAAIKADSGGEEIVAMFLTFLEAKCGVHHLHNLLTSQNIGKVMVHFTTDKLNMFV